MLAAFLASMTLTTSCPAVAFDSLRPDQGAQFTYAFWRDRQRRPGLYRLEFTQVARGSVYAEESFFLVNQQWTEPQPNRVVGGVVLRAADSFNGAAARQLEFPPVSPPLEARRLEVGDTLSLPVRQSAPGRFGRIRNEGAYVLRHAGCGALVRDDGEPFTTRMLEVTYPRYIGGDPWRLVEVVQIYHIPVGAPWFYAVHRAGNHPMVQGTILEGYTVP